MNLRRLKLVLYLFCAVSLIYVARALWVTGVSRSELLRQAEKISGRERLMPCLRGKICDRNGKVLVWSEPCRDLYRHWQAVPRLTAKDAELLKTVLPGAIFETPGLIKHDIVSAELHALAPLLASKRPIELRSGYRRVRLSSAVVQRLVGECSYKEGVHTGTSGWELQYEKQLSGVPGSFTFKVDRFQKFVPGTFRLIKPPISGQDILLSETLMELEQKERLRQ